MRLPWIVHEIVRHRRWSLADLALDLITPPLGVHAIGALSGAAVGSALCAVGVVGAAAVAPWVVALTALPGYVLVGLVAARAPRTTYRALLHAPALVAVELATRARLLRGTRADRWERTARPNELARTRPHGQCPGR